VLRFLLDENLRGVLLEAVHVQSQRVQLPVDIVQVGDRDGPRLGIKDPALLIWAESRNRIIISADKNTLIHLLNEHVKNGRHSPGLLVLAKRFNVGQVAEELLLIAHAGGPEEYSDRVCFM
jgi:hypothetical protein